MTRLLKNRAFFIENSNDHSVLTKAQWKRFMVTLPPKRLFLKDSDLTQENNIQAKL